MREVFLSVWGFFVWVVFCFGFVLVLLLLVGWFGFVFFTWILSLYILCSILGEDSYTKAQPLQNH